MAQEIKNTFLKSKMNKDLDDRILPNGEYRDARNVSVGRSEDDDIGALENVIGNRLMATTDLNNVNLEIIGLKESPVNDTIYVFLTDYRDPNPSAPTNAPGSTSHFIYAFNTLTEEYTKLVEGEFLNFSKSNKIIGINLLESLLFWTDNRNQPRKINVNLAKQTSTSQSQRQEQYYTQEHQISVAKYNPFQAIELYTRTEVKILGWNTSTLQWITVSGDLVTELTPFIGAAVVSNDVQSLTGSDYVFVTSVTLNNGNTRIAFNKPMDSAPDVDDIVILIKSSMTNEDDDVTWPGDPNYLEDKFVRFSYRFKYEDNEYSLMAPFTQIAYIPKQKGYFIEGDEDAAYRSTILDWMENNVQNIGLIIPLPDKAVRVASSYKISEIDILFRQSGTLAVKVLESVEIGQVAAGGGLNNSYTYDYQSRKPYRTLPEAQTVRVYDKVPVTAFSQEVAGNRIIYGNYKDRHTPPSGINYNCRISSKNSSGLYNNFIEYPNHSVKKNRTYQIGFILADKFGRQSSVILSKVDEGNDADLGFYSGSTIYSPYDSAASGTSVKNWFGDAIELVLNSPIQSNFNNASGTPGLYAIPQKNQTTGDGFAIGRGGGTSINGNVWIFRKNPLYPLSQNIPEVGQYLRGEFIDFVKVLTITGPNANLYTVTTDGQVNSSYLPIPVVIPNIPDLRFAYAINDLGWYSYKIVVKQTQQDYYNVYLPGILNGYPGQSLQPTSNIIGDGELEGAFPNDELDLVAHTVLFSDNINKVPRDLAEVGPQEKQFRSSVKLFGRVTNVMINTAGDETPDPSNAQYYPTINNSKNAISHLATTIAAASDLKMSFSQLSNSNTSVITQTFEPTGADNELRYAITNATILQIQNNIVTAVKTSGGSTQPFSNFTIEGSTFVLETPGFDGDIIVVSITGTAGAAGGIDGNITFYNIDSNPFIARLSTTEKAIGWPAEQTINPSEDANDHIWNMQPYLAIYETAPVESLLDIYWEATSAGYIADINSEALTGYEGITSFQNLSWDFPESKGPGDAITSFFEPYSASGVFISNTTVQLLNVINGVNQDVTDNFDIVIGTATPNVGKYQIILADNTNNGFAFTEGSATRDVFYFTIQSTTADGEITENYIGGINGLDGALYNIIPDFTGIDNIQAVQAAAVLLPSTAWINAGVTNGSSVNNPPGGTTNREELVYSMEFVNPTENPGSWEMDSATGQISQIPNATPVGVYTIKIIVTDASGDGGGGGIFGALTHEQELVITIGEEPLNEELVELDCHLNVEPNEIQDFALVQPVSGSPQGGRDHPDYKVASGAFYVSDVPLEEMLDVNNDDNWLGPNGTVIPHGSQVFRLGTGPHTSGTICMNMSIIGRTIGWGIGRRDMHPGPSGSSANDLLYDGEMQLWIKRVGIDTEWSLWSPSWTGKDYNEVKNSEVSRNLDGFVLPFSDGGDWPRAANGLLGEAMPGQGTPDTLQGKVVATWDTITDAGGAGVNLGYANYIRAFNKRDIPSATNGIAYLWTIKGLGSRSAAGNETDRTVAWLTVDDLNNPTCVPWQGQNAVSGLPDPAVKAFPYRYSNWTDSREFMESPDNRVIFARTPYADYADVFFTTDTFETVHKPEVGGPTFMSYNLALTGFPNAAGGTGQLPGWIYGNNGTDTYRVGLNFSAQFETGDTGSPGNRKSNPAEWQSTAILVGNGMDGGSVDPLPFLSPAGSPPVTGGVFDTPGSTNRGTSRMVVNLLQESRP